MKRILLIAMFFVGIPCLVYGNMVWPALYAEAKVNSLPIIALSLALEYLVIRWLFRVGVGRSLLYTVAANITSGTLGVLLRPLSGIVWEISLGQAVMFLFDWGTFNPVAWVSVPVIGGALNAAIELLSIRIVWKERFTKQRFIILWIINGITVGLATIWVIISPSQI